MAHQARELGIAKAALIREYLAQHVEAPAHIVDPSVRLREASAFDGAFEAAGFVELRP